MIYIKTGIRLIINLCLIYTLKGTIRPKGGGVSQKTRALWFFFNSKNNICFAPWLPTFPSWLCLCEGPSFSDTLENRKYLYIYR